MSDLLAGEDFSEEDDIEADDQDEDEVDDDEDQQDAEEYCVQRNGNGQCVDLCEDVSGVYTGLFRPSGENDLTMEVTIVELGETVQSWPCAPLARDRGAEIRTIEGEVDGTAMTGVIAPSSGSVGFCLITAVDGRAHFHQGHFQSGCSAISGDAVDGTFGLVREL